MLLLDKPYHLMEKSNYLWLIDAGHGGLTKEGKYTTKPYFKKEFGLWETKMHIFNGKDGREEIIHEGVINRPIAKLVYETLTEHQVDWALVYDDVEDTPLYERVTIADAIYNNKDKRAVYLSIHSNKVSLSQVAYPTKAADFSKRFNASGFSVYTSKGQTKSDKLANIFCDTYQKHFPNFKFRSDHTDGDADKEEDFYVLRKTDCPALMIENLFYDNRTEASYLCSTAGQQAIADCIVAAILNCEKLKPI